MTIVKPRRIIKIKFQYLIKAVLSIVSVYQSNATLFHLELSQNLTKYFEKHQMFLFSGNVHSC